jgi:hypothetical protein
MEFLTVGMISLTVLAFQAAGLFAIVYLAIRLALRHERVRLHTDPLPVAEPGDDSAAPTSLT